VWNIAADKFGEQVMKVAIYQGSPKAREIEANLDTLARQASDAARQGAQLLVAPEMFTSGYNIGAQNVADLAQPADGAAAETLAGVAEEFGISLLYGYPERVGDAIYNSAQLIDARGSRLTNYRKSHLFGDLDKNAFSAGEADPLVVELEGWKIGILICYDVEFPENVRKLALAGAEVVVVPTALMKPYEFVPRSLLATRAYENGVFAVYANHCGNEAESEYCGLSCVVGPDGADLARAGTGETLIQGELKRDLMDKWRGLNTYMPDRRPGLYSKLVD
jgi:predicted amidohydrolase